MSDQGSEKRLDEYATIKHNLKKLLESKGWEILEDYFKAIRVARKNEIFGSMDKGFDGLIELGKMKSELAGMEFIMRLPEAIYAEVDDEERALRDELENENV